MEVVISRFDVFLISLDPTHGYEIKKTRPCVILSPDVMNSRLRTVIIAPMTSKTHAYPTRVPLVFQGTAGEIVLDQIRTVDRTRLVKRLGKIDRRTQTHVHEILAELFAP